MKRGWAFLVLGLTGRGVWCATQLEQWSLAESQIVPFWEGMWDGAMPVGMFKNSGGTTGKPCKRVKTCLTQSRFRPCCIKFNFPP